MKFSEVYRGVAESPFVEPTCYIINLYNGDIDIISNVTGIPKFHIRQWANGVYVPTKRAWMKFRVLERPR